MRIYVNTYVDIYKLYVSKYKLKTKYIDDKKIHFFINDRIFHFFNAFSK